MNEVQKNGSYFSDNEYFQEGKNLEKCIKICICIFVAERKKKTFVTVTRYTNAICMTNWQTKFSQLMTVVVIT